MPVLPPDWQDREEQHLIRQRVHTDLVDWAILNHTQCGQVPAAHHRLLLEELDQLSRGKLDRLMVLMPPGSAKSTYASILFPAWWFTQHPGTSIIAASHTAGLAQHFSRRLRDTINTNKEILGYRVLRGVGGVSNWRTSTNGEYYAVGVRGGITGRRADLVIIDDPIKSQAEAESSKYRDGIWSWYRTELTTRLKPGARVVLIMTRWHEEDLGGLLVRHDGNNWKVLRLPSLAEGNDPLGRFAGEAIWPTWENINQIERKRSLVGERVWAALFQQTPRPASGGLFRVDKVIVFDNCEQTPSDRIVRAWDLAATTAMAGNDPDWTVGVKLSCNSRGQYMILDVVRIRGSPREVEDIINATARSDGEAVWIGLPEDPGQAGKSQVAYLSGRLAGYKIVAFRETGSKFTRALPIASQIEGNNVGMLRGNWNDAFVDELKDFPLGRKDDQVDALVRGFMTLTRSPNPLRQTSIPYLSR